MTLDIWPTISNAAFFGFDRGVMFIDMLSW